MIVKPLLRRLSNMARKALLVMGILILNPFGGQSTVLLYELTMGGWSGAYDTDYNYFYLINDSLMYLSSGKSNPTMYDLALFDYVNNSFIERFAPYNRVDGYVDYHSPFYKTDSQELLVANEYDYNIYSLTGTELVTKYTLAFNTRNRLPKNHQEIDRIKLSDQFKNTNVVTYIDCLNESDNVIPPNF